MEPKDTHKTSEDTYVLFLDMKEIQTLDNVEVVVNEAEKHPANPVLSVGEPGEFDERRAANWAGKVMYDEEDGIFKCWYFAIDFQNKRHTAYAVSEDGIFWEKPSLGLHEYNGSKDNNIILQPPQPGEADHVALIKDTEEPDPQKRYQALAVMSLDPNDRSKRRNYAHYSPDGIHWTLGTNTDSAIKIGDMGDIIIDHQDPDPSRRIKLFGAPGGGSVFSQNGMWYGPDIEQLQPSEHNPIIDPEEGREHEIHFSYVIPYRGYYIMLYDFDCVVPFEHHGVPIGTRARRNLPAGAYTGDCRVAVSRDATQKFQRIRPEKAVIALGDWGEWDDELLVLGGGSILPFENEIRLYYSAFPHTPGGFLSHPYPRCEMGLATLRKDGFTFLRNEDGLSAAHATTVPIEVTSAKEVRLTLNASHLRPYRDWIEVEVLDAATGKAVPGYEQDSCRQVVREGLAVPVRWEDHPTFSGVQVPHIKLRFHLRGKARLYSFTFA